ncbi:MAG: hypothetical protein H7243_00640 [Sphingomonadaceae bacterium]|nr:hypothetical protein [Sphingomonadaceae bacterium]
MIRSASPAIGLVAMLAATSLLAPAVATENKVVHCRTSAARDAGPSGGAALVANVPGSMTPIDLNAVLMTDKKLTHQVVVEGLFAQRDDGGGLRVVARLVNCTSEALAVQARSNFMDANQLPTEAASAWRTIYLSPRATGTYEERALGGRAVAAYLIELRPNS